MKITQKKCGFSAFFNKKSVILQSRKKDIQIMSQKYLYCYKMTHDSGFAPNPYHDVLTLATCKPTIRRCANKGYWISGWASNVVQGKDKKYTDRTQKLIYLAKVSEKISFAEYWEKYTQKRQPTKNIFGKEYFKSCGNIKVTRNDDIAFCGDNIYEPDSNDPSGYKQHENPHHGQQNKEHDLSGKNVLVCKEFYYFGIEKAIEIKDKNFVVPRCKKYSLDTLEAKNVIDYVTKNYSTGLNPKKNENHFK